MEKKEKERQRIKVSAEVQQKAAEAAGLALGDIAEHSAVQSPVEEAAVLSPAEEAAGAAAAGALDLGMQQQHAHHAALPPPPHPPPRPPPQMLPGPNPFGFPAFPDGFPRPPFGR